MFRYVMTAIFFLLAMVSLVLGAYGQEVRQATDQLGIYSPREWNNNDVVVYHHLVSVCNATATNWMAYTNPIHTGGASSVVIQVASQNYADVDGPATGRAATELFRFFTLGSMVDAAYFRTKLAKSAGYVADVSAATLVQSATFPNMATMDVQQLTFDFSVAETARDPTPSYTQVIKDWCMFKPIEIPAFLVVCVSGTGAIQGGTVQVDTYVSRR